MLNRSSTISQAAIDNIAQRLLVDELAQHPTLDETTAAIKKLSSGKAAGPDVIAAINLQVRGHKLHKEPCKTIQQYLGQQGCSARVQGRNNCPHLYGISLLCIAWKILTCILLNRLSLHLTDNVLPESQGGFRAQRSTIDMIFAARHVQEKCREQNLELCMVSAMLNDAFLDNDLGALIRFRTDGNVFNLRRLNSKTRTFKVLISQSQEQTTQL